MSPEIDKQDHLHSYGLYQAPNAIDDKLTPRTFSPFDASFGIISICIMRKFCRGEVFFQITVARTYLFMFTLMVGKRTFRSDESLLY